MLSQRNLVSKFSLDILKYHFFFYFKTFKGNGFVETVTGFIAFSFTCGIGHCIEGWKPKLAGHLDHFDAAFAPVLFRFLYPKVTIVS